MLDTLALLLDSFTGARERGFGRMGVTPDLTGQARPEAVVVLPQTYPGFANQPDQLAPGRLIQSGVRRVNSCGSSDISLGALPRR